MRLHAWRYSPLAGTHDTGVAVPMRAALPEPHGRAAKGSPMWLDLLAALGGVVLVALSLRDIFLAVIPRASNRTWRASGTLSRVGWPLWKRIAANLNEHGRRDEFLSLFAPFNLFVQIGIWITLLILGFGGIFYALRDHLHPHPNGPGAIYFAGVTLLTIGFGDIVPGNGLTRLVALMTGATGVTIIAVLASFLLTMLAAFNRREEFVVRLSARAGAPPSGIGLLMFCAETKSPQELSAFLREAESWCVSTLDQTLAYPQIALFRSAHDNHSWMSSLGAVLDAAAITVTTVDAPYAQAEARALLGAARHLLSDLANYYMLPHAPGERIDEIQFGLACDRLESAGYTLRDRHDAFAAFSRIRHFYSGHLEQMARWLASDVTVWLAEPSANELGHPMHVR
ncbi:MAG: potassium channel family protein [Candidatus Eremiobacteraeota bacterium]|nr:potassium channel family protein [Candidatus Eremiobacteraeota bacterium]